MPASYGDDAEVLDTNGFRAWCVRNCNPSTGSREWPDDRAPRAVPVPRQPVRHLEETDRFPARLAVTAQAWRRSIPSAAKAWVPLAARPRLSEYLRRDADLDAPRPAILRRPAGSRRCRTADILHRRRRAAVPDLACGHGGTTSYGLGSAQRPGRGGARPRGGRGIPGCQLHADTPGQSPRTCPGTACRPDQRNREREGSPCIWTGEETV
jgi:hypothetical protein